MQQDGYQASTQEVDMQQEPSLEDEANKRPRMQQEQAPMEQVPTKDEGARQPGFRLHGPRNFEELIVQLLDGSTKHRSIREGDCVRIELDGIPPSTTGRYAGSIDTEAAVEIVDGASYTTRKVPWGSWVSSCFELSLIDRSKVDVNSSSGVVLVEPAEPSDFVGCPTERHTVTVPCSALRFAGGPPTREAALDMIRSELHGEYMAVMSSAASIGCTVGDAAAMADFQQRQKNLEEEMELLDELTA